MAALEGQLAAVGIVVPGDVRRHAEAGRHHVVRGNDDGTSVRRARRRDHDAQGVLRPADEIVVVLEIPLRLHRVFSLPEDFRLPRHGHAGRTCRDVGGHDREELAVVGVGQLLALGGLVLLEIRRVGVVGVGRKPGGGNRIELAVRVAAAGGLQAVPDFGVERRHVRRADLHDDVRDHVVLRLRVVVGEHELPLRTLYRARLRVHAVAHGQKLRLRRVVVEAVDDVGDAWRHLAIFAPQQVGVAEELHELAGEVDERGVVGLVHPRREEPVRTGRRIAADRIGLRDRGARIRHPRHFRRAACCEDHPLVWIRRAKVEHDPAFGDRRRVRGNGRGPVDLPRSMRNVPAEVAELGVRRLLGKRPADRPRRKLPLHRRVLGRNRRHLLFGRRGRTNRRDRIHVRRLPEAGGAVAPIDVNGQVHLAKRELYVRRPVGIRRIRQKSRKKPLYTFHLALYTHVSCPPFRRTGRTSP